MKQLLLLLLLACGSVFSQNNYETQSITVPPPPPGLRWQYGVDHNNDGYAIFDIAAYLNHYRNDLLSYPIQNFNASGYFFQAEAMQSNGTYTLITTPTYVNTVATIQYIKVTAIYSGTGPYYGATYEPNTSHSLRVLSANGDMDGDGISNIMEDLNQNLNLNDDNTDGNGYPNFWDSDDDNDGILTINEDYNGNGNPVDDDMNANGIPDYLDFSARGSLPLNLKLFIEGYYTYAGSGMMQPVKFNQDGLSPLTDVENITVELHRASSPYELIASTSAMLKTNGTVACSFPTASVGSYYIAIKSQNGIETWSATPQSISNIALTYNFSNAPNKAYGSNLKNVGGGFFAVYSGDINQDGFLDLGDYAFWEADNNAFAFGMYATDFNGDGFVDLADYAIWEAGNNEFISIRKPE